MGSSSTRDDQEAPRTKKPKRTTRGAAPPVRTGPTPKSLLAKMRQMRFAQTKWADIQLLEEMGILEDVEGICENMGLAGLLRMSAVAYKTETIQFLSTLTIHDDTALPLEDENRGHINFKIDGVEYGITMAQIGSIFNFPRGGTIYSPYVDNNEAQAVWVTIADGAYIKGNSKSGAIRNPAIRYVHKFLANTLFARHETGGVKEEELALIIEGIKPFLLTTQAGDEIQGMVNKINFGHFLVNRFRYVQDWVHKTDHKTPSIHIGGLITPILRSLGVGEPTGQTTPQLARIDAFYLSQAHILAGRSNRRYGYQFQPARKETAVILLPRTATTSLMTRENVIFRPRRLLYEPSRDGPLAIIRNTNADPQAEDEDEEAPELIVGRKRYQFSPFAEPVTGKAIQEAHRHIGLLQRFLKWEDKQVRKLVKRVKEQGKMLKKQGRLIKKFFKDTASPNTRAELEEAGPSTREERGRSAPISPSSSDSDNPTYSLEDYSSPENE